MDHCEGEQMSGTNREAEYQRACYLASREAIKERSRKWLEVEAERRKAAREYYAANREARNVYQRAYREANREAVVEYQRAYYEDHREAINERKRKRYAAKAAAMVAARLERQS